GDGLITALAVLGLVVEQGRPLSELRRVMRRFPQVLVNLRVRDKPDLETVPTVATAMRRAQHELGENGRVLVRYSGTDPLLRVMMEGERESVIQGLADAIADAARTAIGV